jgi:DNA-binding transcriptional LysR family regulator
MSERDDTARNWSALTIDQLQTFRLVAQFGSISRAAEALLISPSAVSQRIDSLERIAGLPLFQRTRGRKPQLTLAGEYLRAFCIHTVQELSQLSVQMDALKWNDFSESLVIAAPPGLVHPLLPLLVSTFRDRHPNIRIRVVPTFDYQVIIRSIESGEADVGVLPDSPLPESILKVPWFVDELAFIASPVRRPSALDEIADRPFALPPLSTSAGQMAEYWARSVGERPRTATRSSTRS